MSLQSLYDRIRVNLTPDGRLPQDFSLACPETAPNKLRFMPGAMDGMSMFHFNMKHSKKAVKNIVGYLISDWKKPCYDSQRKIAAQIKKYGALSVIDPVLDSIRENRKGIEEMNIVDYACNLAFQAAEEGLVKLGISLLGLFSIADDREIIDGLIILAMYEEFTLYVVTAISNIKNKNDILFDIAQKVDGWGKIHTVERLEPATEEIREWLLRKGCENSVMNDYLGLECANKGGLIDALRRDSLDNELFDGISVIIDALLNEGPVEGIRAYKHAEEALQLYLRFADKHAVTVKHLCYVLNVQSWLEDGEIAGRYKLQLLCGVIAGRASWQEMILEILGNPDGADDEVFFNASYAAGKLQMDISELVFEAVRRNPVKRYFYMRVVYKNPDYARQLTEIYEATLPLDDMATGMGDDTFPVNLQDEHFCLDAVLQELQKYPKMGERLVQTALGSPVVRERNGACNVMESWIMSLGQPLQAISLELYTTVCEIAPDEINGGTKERMIKMLGGG